MLANRSLALLSIYAYLIIACQAFFDFNNFMDEFDNNMKQMQTNMENMNKDMVKMTHQMEESLALNVTDLAIRVEDEESDVYFNTGGCKCKDFSCTCCNLVEALSLTPNCYKFAYMPGASEFQVKLGENFLGNNSVSDMSDICYANETLCISFYKLNILNSQIQGCSDLKIKDKNLIVKIGCYFMTSGIDFVNRQLISKHDAGKIEYNFDGNPLKQNKYSTNTWSLNSENHQTSSINML